MRDQRGFTMIELLIAMAVFGFMLSIVLIGFLNIVKIQQAGQASRTTQQNARDISDIIAQTIRTSTTGWVANVNGSLNTLCLASIGGTVEYAPIANGQGSYDLYTAPVAALPPNCPPPGNITGWRKLNDSDTAVPLFQVAITLPVPGALGTVATTVGVASRDDLGDTVVRTDPDISRSTVACNGAAGSQFCAATALATSVALRGSN